MEKGELSRFYLLHCPFSLFYNSPEPTPMSRRALIEAAAIAPACAFFGRAPAVFAARPTDIRIVEVRHALEDFTYRAPYMFGGRVVDRVTMLNVRCRVSNRAGKSATGFAAMPLGNMWAFPAADIPYDTTLAAMKELAGRIARIGRGYREYGHPLDFNHDLLPAYLKAAEEASRALSLPRPIPKLCTLVTASPFEIALQI